MDVAQKLEQHLQLTFKGNDADESGLTVCRLLLQARCCCRCTLRFLGCEDLTLYECPESELRSVFGHLCNQTIDSIVCTTCVGSLQNDGSDAIADALYLKVQEQGYEAQKIAVSATLPICMLHRDRLMKIHITDHLAGETLSFWNKIETYTPKVPFKHLLVKRIRERTPLIPDTDGLLRATVVLEHGPTATEHRFLTQAKKPIVKVRKIRKKGVEYEIGDSRYAVTEGLRSLSDAEARTLTTIPPSPQTEIVSLLSIDLMHEAAFVGGRYLKYSRECSQTPWVVRGKKLTEDSVADSICEIFKNHHCCDDVKFAPAGREDANVRMLGTGRPFYCELVNPRRPILPKEEYLTMQDEINTHAKTKDAVQVRDVTRLLPADTRRIKEGEQFKRKTYRALVWLSDPVTDMTLQKVNQLGASPFTIQQKTPIRVFQRRSAAVREKEIHQCTMERIGNEKHFALLTLESQAGTYIKEFVHGDLGRTLPNLSTMTGAKVTDLLELDVMNVDLEWPPNRN